MYKAFICHSKTSCSRGHTVLYITLKMYKVTPEKKANYSTYGIFYHLQTVSVILVFIMTVN